MNQALIYAQVKVVCPYPIQQITALQYTGRFNEHSTVSIKGMLQDKEKAGCIESAGIHDLVQVYEQRETGEALVFSGVVASLEVKHRGGIYEFELAGLSHTYLLDLKLNSRSFQDQGMPYSTLIEKVVTGDRKAHVIQVPDDRKTGAFILQYQETDWAFLKRMASHFQTVLVPDTLGEVPRCYLGIPRRPNTLEQILSVTKRKDRDQYQWVSSYGLDVWEDDFIKYEVESYTRLRLGDGVSFHGKDYVVESVSGSLINGLLRYQYVLGTERASIQPRIRNEQIQGVSLLGDVLDAQNQEVKIRLRIDNEQEIGKACWFPYAAQANNLLYCMPEKGTSLSLYFPNAEESSGIAVNTVRRNGGSCSKTSNPNLKYLGIPSGQEFKLGETDVDFTANEKLLINMDGGSGIQLQSHQDVTIVTKQKLILEAQNLFRVFSKTGDVVVAAGAQGEKAQLYLMGGMAGDANVFSEGEIMYEGRYRQVLEDRLNAEIEYEEVSFNFWEAVGKAVAAVAVVALVVGAVVLTGGGALAAIGVCATKFAFATIATAAVFATAQVIDDWYNDETSSFSDYLKAAAQGGLTGAAIVLFPALAGTPFGSVLLSSPLGQVGLMALKGYAAYQFGKVLYEEGQNVYNFFVHGESFNPSRLFRIAGTAAVAYATNFVKDPVDVLTGVMVLQAVDFELPGPLPFTWSRTWYSDSRLMGQLGHGMRHTFEMGVEVFEDERLLVAYLEDGREIVVPYLLVGEEHFSHQAKRLFKREADCYTLFDPETRDTYRFERVAGGFLSYQLVRISDEQGHCIQLHYDRCGFLTGIIDSAGRQLSVTTNEQGQVLQVAFHQEVLVRYRYNEERDLIEVTDAMGNSTHMKYQNHLMVQKTDRNRHSFYWKYEYAAPGARVLETWGDGGLFHGKFVYHEEEGYTEVIDRLGGVKAYHYDERRVPTRIVYGDLTQIRMEYNERFELVREIDEEGRVTTYTYDDWSQPTAITRPDGTAMRFEYDPDGRLIQSTNPEGDRRQWVYNEDGTLHKLVDEAGAATSYTYNEARLIETVTTIKEDTTHLSYDPAFNLAQVTLSDGTASKWEYDKRGNCVMAVNPLGAVERYQYDRLNRLIRTETADGNSVELQYNGYDDVISVKDQQTEVSYTYSPLGSLTSRKQGGKVVRYQYDAEERLVAVINEAGETYRFERDKKGHIVKETGFDQVTKTYQRDQSGLIKRIHRPGGRFTAYQYDKMKRVIRVDYFDQTWDNFSYNKNGALMEAVNESAAVRFERNQLGQVTKEWQNDHWVTSEYDERGNRTRVISSLGANIAAARNQLGQVSHLAAAQAGQSAWTATMDYNELGQETMRTLPGDVGNEWRYDTMGRPMQQRVRSRNRDVRRRKYGWNINHRLTSIKNELTGRGTTYRYSESGDLIRSQDTGFDWMHRAVDAVGNLYETEDRSDRVYGKGSRLLQSDVKAQTWQSGAGRRTTNGNTFTYDEEGNLIQKAESSGAVWRYEYDGSGMLAKVIKPDQTEVTFRYDALGRRMEKSSDVKTVRFVWDGNTPLHEWEEKEEVSPLVNPSLVTWLFDDGFTPLAKLTKEGNYSIISDHLGTPVEAYDHEGKQVWSIELDLYGRIKEGTGGKEFIPFRYPGQYADGETGLSYNRFRYYSPDEGCYTQSDPIGLAGGNPTLYAYVSNPTVEIDPLGLWTIKIGGYVIRVHANDVDPWPSSPHGHIYDKGLVIDKNGNIFKAGNGPQVDTLSKKDSKKWKKELKQKGCR